MYIGKHVQRVSLLSSAVSEQVATGFLQSQSVVTSRAGAKQGQAIVFHLTPPVGVCCATDWRLGVHAH